MENPLTVLKTWDDLKPQVHEHLIGFQVVRRLPLKISYQLSKKSKEPFINDISTGKSLSEALLFAEHGENMLCTKIVLNVRHNFCTQYVLPRFELGIFM